MFFFEPLSSAMELGPYVLTHAMGHGLLGETYLARSPEGVGPLQWFKIKHIYYNYSRDDAFTQLLERRVHELSRLHHPAIVPALELGHADRRMYIRSAYVPGLDLGTVLEMSRVLAQPWPAPLVAYLGHVVWTALEYARRWRDPQNLEWTERAHHHLSPSNLVLTAEGDVVLTDYGLAEAHDILPDVKQMDRAQRHAYVPPEGLTYPAPPLARDLYALGLILFEAVTGAPEHARDQDQRRRYVPLASDVLSIVEALLDDNPARRVALDTSLGQSLRACAPSHQGRAALGQWLQGLVQRAEQETFRPSRWMSTPAPASTVDIAEMGSASVSVVEVLHGLALNVREEAVRQGLIAPATPSPMPDHFLPRQTLQGALQHVAQGHSAGVLLVGPSGAGKTFALRDFFATVRDTQSACLAAYLTPVSPSRPFGLVAAWLEAAAGVLAVDDRTMALQRVKAMAQFLSLDDASAQVLETLCGLRPLSVMTPGVLLERAYAVVRRWIEVQMSSGPVVVVVDNFQFVDPVSFRLLHALLHEAATLPTLWVLACDDVRVVEGLPEMGWTRLALTVPSPRDVVSAFTPTAALPASARARWEQWDVSATVMADVLAMANAVARQGFELADVVDVLWRQSPQQRVESLLQALPAEDVQLLRWLAIALEPLSVFALSSLMSMSPGDQQTRISALQADGLVIEPVLGRLTLCSRSFVNDLRRLEQTPSNSELHTYLAYHLSGRLWAGAASPLTPLVQEQFMLAGDINTAFDYARDYAVGLEDAGFPEVALTHLARVHDDLERARVSNPVRRVQLLLMQTRLAVMLGQAKVVETHVDALVDALHVSQHDPVTHFDVALIQAQWCRVQGDFEGAERFIATARHALESLTPQPVRLQIRWAEADSQRWFAQGAMRQTQVALEHAQRLLSPDDYAGQRRLAPFAVRVLARRGLIARARQFLSHAQRLLRDAPQHAARVGLALAEADIGWVSEKPDVMHQKLREAAELALEAGLVSTYLEVLTVLAQDLWGRGQSTEALAVLEPSEPIVAVNGRLLWAQRVRQIADLLIKLTQGKPVSVTPLRRALAASKQMGVPAERLFWATCLTHTLASQGRRADARAARDELLAAREACMR